MPVTPGKSAMGKIRSKQQAEINTTELGRLSPTLYTSLPLEFHIRRRKFREPPRATWLHIRQSDFTVESKRDEIKLRNTPLVWH